MCMCATHVWTFALDSEPRWSATKWKRSLPGCYVSSGYTLDDEVFHPFDERAHLTALISARGCVTTCEVGWNVSRTRKMSD